MKRSFYIDVKHFNKIIDYARTANKLFNTEIGGMLIALKDEEDDWKLMNPVILTQDVTGASTILDKEELAMYYNTIAMNKKYGPKTQFVWWHSHNDMEAYFSSTDTNTMKEYKGGTFSMSLVVNISGDYVFRVSIWDPVTAYEELELDIIGQKPTLSKAIIKEVQEKCTKPVTTAITQYKNGKRVYGGYKSADQEIRDYNRGFNQCNIFGDDEEPDTYNTLYEAIDELNNELCGGAIDYKDWIGQVQVINKQLKQRSSGYSLKEFSKNELSQRVYYLHPHDYIKGNAYSGYRELGGHF